MTITDVTERVRAHPHTLTRIGVHKKGLVWEVDMGTPTPVYTSPEWALAQATALRIAERWRAQFVAWNW